MTTKLNTALRNAMAEAMGGLFDGGTLEIYTGTQPASANDDVASGDDLLLDMTLPTPAFGSATTGTVSKAGNWEGNALADGTAGYFRMVSSDGLKSKDGNVTSTGGGGELELDDTNLVLNGLVTVTSASITQPAE